MFLKHSPAGNAPQATGRWRLASESLILCACVYFALAMNGPFWRAALDGHALGLPRTWLYGAAVFGLLVGLHAVLLGLVLHRRWMRPVLALLVVTTAFASYFMGRYAVVLDPDMLRNVLRTDVKEARELFGWGLVPHLLVWAVLPLALLWRFEVAPRPWRRALGVRTAFLLAMAGVSIACLLVGFQDISALMRNHKTARYLVTPGNYLYSAGRVLARDARQAGKPRMAIGTDAHLGPTWQASARPVAMVLVVGETARAANWGLNGYARQTTPELAALQGQGLLNFPQVEACGTNTETSVPCMFSPGGLHDYDEARIRGSESLLHVARRAGIPVLWRDNQSGCKGVCEGLPEDRVSDQNDTAWCRDGQCYDEILVAGLARRFTADGVAAGPVSPAAAGPSVPAGSRLVVLHEIGNHGPAYFRRYPDAFRRFTPACETAELHLCSREEITNAYDNALLYTDHVLAQAIAELRQLEATHDTVLLYVSDHGESLGESNLYLHGMPRLVAPDLQLKVPMVAWMSPSFGRRIGLDAPCWADRATQPASHDNLFHTVLGLLDVRTTEYQAAYDLSAACRRPTPAVGRHVAAARP